MVGDETVNSKLLSFFRALADANRLKILGLLAQEELTVEQLSEMLDLRPSTVSHHLSKLSEAGLVSARASSYYNIYHLENTKLEAMARQLLSEDTLPGMASGVNMEAYDLKVIKDFSLPDGQLKTIPAQRKKLEVVLRHIGKSLQPGVTYTEPEINQILERFHQDTATLRRELIGMGLLERAKNGKQYWLVEHQKSPKNSKIARD